MVILGYAISEKEIVVVNAGRGIFVNALRSFDGEDPDKLDQYNLSHMCLTCCAYSAASCRALMEPPVSLKGSHGGSL